MAFESPHPPVLAHRQIRAVGHPGGSVVVTQRYQARCRRPIARCSSRSPVIVGSDLALNAKPYLAMHSSLYADNLYANRRRGAFGASGSSLSAPRNLRTRAVSPAPPRKSPAANLAATGVVARLVALGAAPPTIHQPAEPPYPARRSPPHHRCPADPPPRQPPGERYDDEVGRCSSCGSLYVAAWYSAMPAARKGPAAEVCGGVLAGVAADASG